MTFRLSGTFLVFSLFALISCGSKTSDVIDQLRDISEGGSTVVTLIDAQEQTITLNYDNTTISNPTSCSIIDPVGVTITTPCSCSAGICTVGVTPTGTGSASFNYTASGTEGIASGESDITVTNMVPFVSLWRVGNGSYGDGDNTVTLPLREGFNYNFTVDWGDGNSDEVTSYNDPDINHTYSSAGDYTITISGIAEAWYFNNTGDKDKIISISELGTVGWKNFEKAFYACSNLATISGGNTSNVTDMSSMFTYATAADPDTSGWDTSEVTNMAGMFYDADAANPDTSGWDTSSVTNMLYMFYHSAAANPDTSNWNTSNVTSMAGMFMDASAANPSTSNWDTSKVTDMSEMFKNTNTANPDTSGWDTSSVTNMGGMFDNANAATPNTSAWDTSNVTSMARMFAGTALANPDTSGWNTSNVTSMRTMFAASNLANPDTSNWDTSNVTDMYGMFINSNTADPDMSAWDFSSVTNLIYMFTNTSISTGNYDNLLIRLDATAGSGLTLDAGTSQYTSGGAAATARANLVSDSWTINDGGSI